MTVKAQSQVSPKNHRLLVFMEAASDGAITRAPSIEDSYLAVPVGVAMLSFTGLHANRLNSGDLELTDTGVVLKRD